MKLRYLFLLLFILLLAYLGFYPVPIQPVVWTPYDNPGFTGVYAENNILAETEYLFEGNCYKCEDVDVDPQGRIYGASEDGKIYQFDGNQRSTLVETQGRPLGLHFDSLGNLITADTEKGLLSIAPNGKLDTLSSNYKGYYYKFTDDLDIAPMVVSMNIIQVPKKTLYFWMSFILLMESLSAKTEIMFSFAKQAPTELSNTGLMAH
jgi:hypothetical protein